MKLEDLKFSTELHWGHNVRNGLITQAQLTKLKNIKQLVIHKELTFINTMPGLRLINRWKFAELH